MTGLDIRRVDADEARALADQLASVLIDCVVGGASIGFMLPLERARAVSFWSEVADSVGRGERALLVAQEDGGPVIGTVQLILALPENQPHRAEVAKMLVRTSARRRGLASSLLAAAEEVARAEGRSVLVLDAVTDGDAARLYARLGWVRVGDVPNFALMPDGASCSTTYFHRQLA